MINGKTVKNFEVVQGNRDIRSEVAITFTDGTTLSIVGDGNLDFYQGDKESGRNTRVHPANL